jgi:hypothetical protein
MQGRQTHFIDQPALLTFIQMILCRVQRINDCRIKSHRSSMTAFAYKKTGLIILLLSCISALIFCLSRDRDKIDFSTEVKPIINKNCITCHGGVKAKGGFSLLFREDALAKTESGKPAIIPGDPEGSEMIRRLSLKDPEERMPYHHEPLAEAEKDILTRWVKEGAVWGEHWAYKPLQPVAVPDEDDEWIKNDIDRFVLNKLAGEKLKPSAAAGQATLLRRVALDLTGMPAPASLAEKFLTSNDPKAFEVLVDSLLASSGYGERWASVWLDLARYADTKGYERDDSRNIWRYRDWLIKAFNEDKPYDRFLTEQIAGDLLPEPNDAQLIATAFHRNTMTNDEGGTDNEEFRTAAVLDRVNTTWEALMGTTFSCVQCHSHPYDPFRHEDYYKFMAYFNDSRDEDTFSDYPLLRSFDDSTQRALDSLTFWVNRNAGVAEASRIKQFARTWQPAINSLLATNYVNGELNDTKWLAFRNHGSAKLSHISLEKASQLTFRYITKQPKAVWKLFRDSLNGPLIASINLDTTKGFLTRIVDIPMQSGVHDIYMTYDVAGDMSPLKNLIRFDWFSFSPAFPGKEKAGYADALAAYTSILNSNLSTTPIMMDNPAGMHRESNVFERGNWMVKGEKVTPDVPQIFQAAMPAKAPRNRLGMAMWLTDKKNPLVARTMVNRLWEQLFGTGLAETLEDMGTQGIPPVHRELLDHLAWKFISDYKWSMKKLLKEMVTSATYMQDSKVSDELKEKDPYNKFLARAPRVRLSAEQVRDQALCISGAITKELYGPSVFPFQPGGIWLSPYNGLEWRTSKDGQQYRRAVYTFWKRTASYPSMISFDATSREVCTPRRIRTNTPLQALVTLNDSAYLDMSRVFAKNLMAQAPQNATAQIKAAYKQMLYCEIPEPKLRALLRLYETSLTHYRKNNLAANELTGSVASGDPAGFAAMVVVANAMLNLDDVLTKS